MGSLLTNTAEWFKSRGHTCNFLKDDGGYYAFRTTVKDAGGVECTLYVAAKRYAYNGRVSFMRKLVARAADPQNGPGDYSLLCLRLKDSRLVFDPEFVLEAGQESDDNSTRQQRGEEWLEVPVRDGVALHAAMDGREVPTSTDDLEPERGQRALGDY